MAATRPPARRRRARRGSLERPVNARLYRGSLLVLVLPLLVLAFSVVRVAPLPPPPLPANFDGAAAGALWGFDVVVKRSLRTGVGRQ